MRKDHRARDLIRFVEEAMTPGDGFAEVLERSKKAGLPDIQIGALEGMILKTLAASCGAKKAVEIGTLGGYSGHWIASALPAKGRLYTLEIEDNHARAAREAFEASGLARKVSVVEGPALESLANLAPLGPFDFCFIDADKTGYPEYLKWAAAHLRPGGIVALDNAFLFGKLHLAPADAGEHAAGVRAMRAVLDRLTDPGAFRSWCMIPTGEGLAVGVK